MLETHLRQAATALLESAIRIAPPDTREWGQAMRGELSYVQGPWAAVMWALGGASVMVRHALISLFIPGRRGQGITPDGGLFAKNISLRKAALVTAGGCILAALLFFLAPPFRQALRVALKSWHFELAMASQPSFEALAQRAELQHDPEGLAFCAVRLQNSRESARLAEEAVRLDPSLLWVYAVVGLRHPELDEINQWMPRLARWDPQNSLLHLIEAGSTERAQYRRGVRTPTEEQDQAWRGAMAAAFQSPRFDDYLDRLSELNRRVATRYHLNDPDELLCGEEELGIPFGAFWDSQRFAKSILQSGQNREARGDRKGAGEQYWAVARFGQVMDSQAHTSYEHWAGTALQAMAYKQLQALTEKEGNAGEARLFSYLAAKFDLVKGEQTRFLEEWVFGQEISRRNAAVLQISSLTMLIFSGLMVIAASILIAGSRPGGRLDAPRTQPAATIVALTSAVGFLLSSGTIYLTYRPYWYIFQHGILNGDRSQARDLRNFLMATEDLVPPNLPVYFWMGVTVLGVIGLVLILLRHFPAQPRPNSFHHSLRVP